MFKKALLVSVVFHLLFLAGLELVKEHPDQLRASLKHSPLLIAALEPDYPSTTRFLSREQPPTENSFRGNGVPERSLLKDHRERSFDLGMAEETPPRLPSDGERIEPEIGGAGPVGYEVGAEDSLKFDSSGPVAQGTAGYAANLQEASELDSLPLKLHAPSPQYPYLARKNQWEGVTVLEMTVREDGLIGEITILQSSGYRVLDQAAVKTVKGWRYQPAFKNGNPVTWPVRVKIKFVLE
ncbi:MAG: energy transducer TonB [Firmicutes bacterium]|nr:energy transducer TonB [Bacillota bacterium]